MRPIGLLWLACSICIVQPGCSDRSSNSQRQPAQAEKATPKAEPGKVIEREQTDDVVKSERERFQGVWVLSSSRTDGRDTPPEGIKKLTDVKIIVTGDIWTCKVGDEPRFDGTYRLDPAKTPKWFDFTNTSGPNKGKTFLAIYKLEVDTLSYCEAAQGKLRPSEFAAKPASGRTLNVFKREKP